MEDGEKGVARTSPDVCEYWPKRMHRYGAMRGPHRGSQRQQRRLLEQEELAANVQSLSLSEDSQDDGACAATNEDRYKR